MVCCLEVGGSIPLGGAVYIYIYTYMYVLYVYMCVYIHIHVYVHIHTHRCMQPLGATRAFQPGGLSKFWKEMMFQATSIPAASGPTIKKKLI